NDRELEQIVKGRHGDPHRVLGWHDGTVRAYRPDAIAMRVVADGRRMPMTRIHPAGVFEARVLDGTAGYRLEADYGQPQTASTFVFEDPYRAWPTIGEL